MIDPASERRSQRRVEASLPVQIRGVDAAEYLPPRGWFAAMYD